MYNPLLKTLKENDIVLIEIRQPNPVRPPSIQIARINNLKFIPKDESCSFDWLDFDGEILYTNARLHKSILKKPIGNCYAIKEKLPNNEKFLENYANINGLWKAELYMYSDEEVEHIKEEFAISPLESYSDAVDKARNAIYGK